MRASTASRRQQGMSLMEMIVAMAIGLIGITIITQVYLVNENVKRSTVSSGGAQVNGTLALYNLERDIRMAGYGIAHSAGLGCNTINYYYNGTYSQPPVVSTLPTMYMAPVTIVTTAGQPDSVNTLYGSAQDRPLPAIILQNMPGFNSDIVPDNQLGFYSGDFLILSSGARCTLTQLVANPAATGNNLRHDSSTGSLYNPGAPAFAAYFQGSYVFDLGPTPVSRTYSVSSGPSGGLNMTTILPAAAAGTTTLVDSIVDMRVRYGKDDGGGGGVPDDGTVDTWDTVTPTTAAGWQQVLAVRIAVLGRSEHYEKPSSGSACDASSATLAWSGGTFAIAAANRCYKHRVFETVVPMRNMIWRTQ